MSDFDTVLERLVSDPGFQTALAADPDRALAGYTLDPSERELLGARMVAGSGDDRTVELRTSKSGVVGLLGPVAAAFGLAGAGASHTHESFGGGAGHEAFGAGAGTGHQAFGSAVSSDGGTAGGPGTEVFGSAGPHEAFGSAPEDDSTALGTAPVEATDYHTRVDVDGDGKWDAYTAYERSDGGVDIEVDVDHDGRIDFVGRDYDRDGLVDDADFDRNRDGVLETRMFDDNGDGWMDRKEAIPAPPPTGHAAPPPTDVPDSEHQSWG